MKVASNFLSFADKSKSGRLFVLIFWIISFSSPPTFAASKTKESESPYHSLARVLEKDPGSLAECHCLPGMTRDLGHLEVSLRGKADQKAAEYLFRFNNSAERPTLFFIGSRQLLNEATMLSILMSHHVSPRIVLIDQAYAFRFGKKIEPSKITPAQLEKSLSQFDKLIFDLSRRCGSNQNQRKSSAFFLFDLFFIPGCLPFLKDHIKAGLNGDMHSRMTFDSLFFFLGKKDDGEVKFPVTEADKNPPDVGFDPAALAVYQVQIKNGVQLRLK